MIADIILVLTIALTAFTTLLSLAVLAAVRAGTSKGWDFKSGWYLAAVAGWIAWVVIR